MPQGLKVRVLFGAFMQYIFEHIVYWGSFLVFPIVTLILWYRKKISLLFLAALLIGCLVFIWARFIEPQMIIVREQTIETGFTGRVALIADTHLGIYKDSAFLERVVRVINKQKPEYVLIAGDFTFEPREGDLSRLFAALSDIEAPVYGVLGNHDVERPGPPVREELKQVLEDEGVTFLNNNKVALDNFTLIGLGDNWSKEDDVSLLDELSEQDNVVVLTHNPDTTSTYTNNKADVTLTGHTHCGQVRLPWITYAYVQPTIGRFDKGLTQEQYTQLYITCGLGEVIFPLRLFNPPAVDILNFK